MGALCVCTLTVHSLINMVWSLIKFHYFWQNSICINSNDSSEHCTTSVPYTLFGNLMDDQRVSPFTGYCVPVFYWHLCLLCCITKFHSSACLHKQSLLGKWVLRKSRQLIWNQFLVVCMTYCSIFNLMSPFVGTYQACPKLHPSWNLCSYVYDSRVTIIDNLQFR